MLSFRPPQSVTMGMVPYRCAHICKHALAAGNSCSLNIFGTDFSESLDRGLKIYVHAQITLRLLCSFDLFC